MPVVFNPFTGNLDLIDNTAAAGSDTQVQFNDGGVLGGDSGLVFNKTTNALTGGAFIPTSSTVPTNGVYLPAANSVALSTNGTGRLFVDASGTLKVGTSADPTFGLLPRPAFYIKALSDPSNCFGGVHIEAAGEQSVLGIGYDGTAQAFSFGTSYRATGAHRPIVFQTNNTERLRITSAGLVGIGTSSPSVNLDISPSSGAAEVRIAGAEGQEASIRLYADQGDDAADLKKILTDTSGNFKIQHYAGSSFVDSLVIDSSGKIGIGNASPQQPLHIKNAGSSACRLVLENTGSSVSTSTQVYSQNDDLVFDTNSGEAVRIDSSRRLLVGTSSDSGGALLQVNGNRIRVATAKTPSSASDTGTAGEICWDASYIYVCTATNTWKRAALSTW